MWPLVDKFKKLMECHNNKEVRLSANSQDSKLWSSYIRYVNIVQTFFETEKNVQLVISFLATNLILSTFPATGHNYAKTCLLYLQSISTLEEKHPDIYQQVMK